MTNKTRSRRVTKPRGHKVPRGGSTTTSGAGMQPKETTPTKPTRSQRGRQRGGRTLRQNVRPKATKAAKKAAPAPEPKVDRIDNDIYTTTVETHLAFVADGSLATDQNTETIALNVMDHIIRPENWDASLSRNVLCAACFYFASMVTGKPNSASSVATSLNWYWEKLVGSPNCAWYAKEQFLLAMSVTMDELEQGYALLWDQRDRLEDLVGDFKARLAQLPTPDVECHTAAENGERVALDEGSAADEEPRELAGEPSWEADEQAHVEDKFDSYDYLEAIDNQVGLAELDDFDLYVAENE